MVHRKSRQMFLKSSCSAATRAHRWHPAARTLSRSMMFITVLFMPALCVRWRRISAVTGRHPHQSAILVWSLGRAPFRAGHFFDKAGQHSQAFIVVELLFIAPSPPSPRMQAEGAHGCFLIVVTCGVGPALRPCSCSWCRHSDGSTVLRRMATGREVRVVQQPDAHAALACLVHDDIPIMPQLGR